MEQPLALVLCKDAETRRLLIDALERAGVSAEAAPGVRDALDLLRTRPVDLMLIEDPASTGVAADLRERAGRVRPTAVALALVPRSSISTRGPQLIEQGWFEVWPIEPFDLDDDAVALAVGRTAAQGRLLTELDRLRAQLRGRGGFEGLIGRSVSMERLRERLERQAPLLSPLLFVGESGSGREFAARRVHSMSPRQARPFLTVDCGGMTADALETELFGYERDPNAGNRRAVGVLEAAEGGAVFLDEVSRLPDGLQARLLAALDNRAFVRQGGQAPVAFDVRVYAASSEELGQAVAQGRFLPQLFRQLSVGSVQIPALRERVEDIPLLVQGFVDAICDINELPPYHFSPDALQFLENYGWPGNVRELRNVMEQAVILATGQTIRATDLPHAVRQSVGTDVADTEGGADRPFRAAKKQLVEAFERSYLRDLMERYGGNVTAAAHQAGMLRSALQRLLRKYDIKSAEFRASGGRNLPKQGL